MRGGKTQVVEVPEPAPSPGSVLVANAASAISSGTERSVVASGSGSLAARAIKNPNLVAQTLKHARDHGVRETIGTVRGAVAQDNPLGYSSAGTVLDTGGDPGVHVGQRVACAGAGRANHAEVVSVPPNLVVPVPEGVSLRDASFAAIGAIAIQGVRRAEPSLGDRVVVVGLGLLGLITVQALRAAGARVAGVEPLEARRALASELGAERVAEPRRGRGRDLGLDGRRRSRRGRDHGLGQGRRPRQPGRAHGAAQGQASSPSARSASTSTARRCTSARPTS